MGSTLAIALLIVAGAALSWAHLLWTCAYVRRAHPAVWTALGEPSFANASLLDSGRLWTFVWFGHTKIDDLKLRAYVVSGQVLQVLVVLLVLSLIAANGMSG